MSGGPLEGVRVLDLTSVVVGPLATQILADHGAEVIKVETKAGDLIRVMNGKSVTPGMGAKFLHLNRNKRSIVLDLKQPAGYAALLKLVTRADVLVWNVRPAAMARLKLSYDDVRAVNPKVIYCGMFGFGQDGRYRDKPAYDTILQGAGGMAALHHRATGEPRYVPMVVVDKISGLIAAQMIAMALYRRAQTGEGCAIEIPMFENLVKFVLEEHLYLKTFEPPLGETGDPRLLDPLGKPIPTKDGWISISANTDEQAFAFFAAIGRPELKDDPRFASVQNALRERRRVLQAARRRAPGEDDRGVGRDLRPPRRPGDALSHARQPARGSAPRGEPVLRAERPPDRRQDPQHAAAEQVVERGAARLEPRAQARPALGRGPARGGLQRGRGRAPRRGRRHRRRPVEEKPLGADRAGARPGALDPHGVARAQRLVLELRDHDGHAVV